MSNKIETYGASIAAQAARIKSAENGASAGSGRIAGAQPSDSVKLTGDAVRLQQLEQAMADVPDVDMQRVEQVRQALRDGSYQVNPQAVAARLARMEWDLAHTR